MPAKLTADAAPVVVSGAGRAARATVAGTGRAARAGGRAVRRWPIVSGALFTATLAVAGIGWLRQQKRRRTEAAAEQEWETEQQQWRLRFAAAAGLDDIRLAPHLYDRQDLPTSKVRATHRRLLFQLAAGTEYAQFAGCEKRLGSAIAARHVVIEPYLLSRTGSSDDQRAHPCAIVVTHDLPAAGLVERPHLDGTLDAGTLSFAVRASATAAFHAVGLEPPTCLGVERLTIPGAALLVESRWMLTGGMLGIDIKSRADRLQAMLGCEWLAVLPHEPGTVRLLFGTHPDELDDQVLVVGARPLVRSAAGTGSSNDGDGSDSDSADDESDPPAKAA